MFTVLEIVPNGLFPVAVNTVLGVLSLPASLLFVRPMGIGIRDGGLFWFFSRRFLRMRCFLLTSSLDEELFPLLLFKRFTLRTGILDFCWTGERQFLAPSISLLSWHEAIAFKLVFDAVFERQLSPNFSRSLLFGFVPFCKFSLRFHCEKYHNSLAPNLNADRTDSWSKWSSFVSKPWKRSSIVSS